MPAAIAFNSCYLSPMVVVKKMFVMDQVPAAQHLSLVPVV